MFKRIKILGALVCCLSLAACSQRSLGPSAFVPPKGKTLLMIGQDRSSIESYIGVTGDVPAGFMMYTSVQEAKGLDEAADYGSGVQHAQAFVDRYPKAVIQIGLYMVDALDGIVRGEFDENLDKIGEWIKKARRPVYVRIGYEFDLPQNRYEPQKYQQAFRYIVDRWRSQGVRASYVWHSYGFLNPDKPMMDWYPGDEYVDWFGVSFFHAFNDGNIRWIVNRANEHGKPVMMAEATPSGIGALQGDLSWRRWFGPFFETIRKYGIAAVCYINADWDSQPMWKGQGWGDSRIQVDPLVKERWTKEVSDDRFLFSSDRLFSALGF